MLTISKHTQIEEHQRLGVDQAQEFHRLSSTERAIDQEMQTREQDMAHYLVILVLEAIAGCQCTTQLLLGFNTEVLKHSMSFRCTYWYI